jgi:hypothetical protein
MVKIFFALYVLSFLVAVDSFEIKRPISSWKARLPLKIITAISILSSALALSPEVGAISSPSESKSVERSFDKLPKGAKKRQALDMCKDKAQWKNAGYDSAYNCVQDVMAGDFKIAGAASKAAPKKK